MTFLLYDDPRFGVNLDPERFASFFFPDGTFVALREGEPQKSQKPHNRVLRFLWFRYSVFFLSSFRLMSKKSPMQAGFMLLLVGMGTVFTFLVLLVGCLQLSALFFKRFGHHFADPAAESPEKDESEYVAIAIAAAHAACSSSETGNAP